jgi:polygalacturonase
MRSAVLKMGMAVFLATGLTGLAQAADAPSGWTKCAQPGATCTMSGTHQAAMGRAGVFAYQTFTGNFACALTNFPGAPSNANWCSYNPAVASSSSSASSVASSAASSVAASSSSSSIASSSSSAASSSTSSQTASTCTWRSTWTNASVTTPFAAPNTVLNFTVPTIPCKVFAITSYGAVSNGTTLNTAAFASAVAAAQAAGGGVVDVPAGTWLTGAIHLGSNMELHLEPGATILFSQNINDYLPAVPTRWEGLDVMNFSPFIYALNAHDVAITGPGRNASSQGVIDGNGSSWWGWKSTSATEDNRIYSYYISLLNADGTLPNNPLPALPTSAVNKGLRPSLVECNNCQNFMIDGIKTQNAPYWVLHPLYSSNVIIRNSNITSNSSGSNGDGVDVDSSSKVLIENDTFSTSDDFISLKSGLNEDGIAVGKPTELVVVRDFTVTAGHAFSVGSEMSGGIRNVFVSASSGSNAVSGPEYLFRMKTMPGRGGYVKDIWYQNVSSTKWSKYAVELTTAYGSSTIAPHNTKLIPQVSNITISNLSGTSTSAPALNLVGLSAAPYQNIKFISDTLTGSGSNGCKTITGGITFTSSTISGISGSTITCP